VWSDADIADSRPVAGAITSAEDLATDTAAWEGLKGRLDWTYPHQSATLQPAKSSVSVLRRNAAEADLEAQPLPFATPPSKKPEHRAKGRAKSAASAVEVGNAHHHFLQLMDLPHLEATAPEDLEKEASRLREAGALGKPEFELLDFKALAAFWNSPIGRQIREHAGEVWRELAFTARFSPSDLERLVGAGAAQGELGCEFIVVQGVVDLAVILPGEIWLLDFKTDDLAETEVADRAGIYAPQLRLYSHALSRIYHRPVSRADLWFLTPGRSFRVELGG
jgi:ATP-dependent helicase/nuclease subunit A